MDNEGGNKSGVDNVRTMELPADQLRKQHNQRVLAEHKKKEEAKKLRGAEGTAETSPEEALRAVLVAMVQNQAAIGKMLTALATKVEAIQVQLGGVEHAVVTELQFLSEVVLTGPAGPV